MDDLDNKLMQMEEAKRNAFVAEMKDFLVAHATNQTDVDQLLNYAIKKTGTGFNYLDVVWTAQRDSIRCYGSWVAHSFFDDGGGEKGYRDWSITFISLDGNYSLQNEKLCDISRYFFTSHVSDRFYCKDPFGLKGIYEIRFDGCREKTD